MPDFLLVGREWWGRWCSLRRRPYTSARLCASRASQPRKGDAHDGLCIDGRCLRGTATFFGVKRCLWVRGAVQQKTSGSVRAGPVRCAGLKSGNRFRVFSGLTFVPLKCSCDGLGTLSLRHRSADFVVIEWIGSSFWLCGTVICDPGDSGFILPITAAGQAASLLLLI